MNQTKQNNFVWNAQKPINWSFPTTQNQANVNFNSNPSMNPIKTNTNSAISTSNTWKPITMTNTLKTTNQTNLDPVEDMDWSYYEPSYYQRNYQMYFSKKL